MKIGILTHHYINNFGAFLQAYALQQAVQELYPEDEVVIINYVNVKHFIINTAGWFRFYRNRETLKDWYQKIHLPKTFRAERKKYMNLTKICFSASDINRLSCDCIVVGSDEVWNYDDKKSNAKVKFGCGLKCKNIISYAPSVGKTNFSEKIPKYVNEGISKFKYLSSRDDLTDIFVSKITSKKPVRVLDPTFLSDFPNAKLAVRKKPYILFYYCEKLPSEYIRFIQDYAKMKGYAIYGAGECNRMYDQITVNLTPFEWIEMFRNADFIFTGTFHGAVFSILNKKQFACYLTNLSRIKKVNALLKSLEIKDRVIEENNSIQKILESKIDYSTVENRIKQQRETSMNYLLRSIME